MTCVGSWALPLGLNHASEAVGLNSVSMTTLSKGRDRTAVAALVARGVAHANRFKPQPVSLTRSKVSATPLMMLSDAARCGSAPPPGQSCSSTKVLWRSSGTLGRARSKQRPLRAPLRALWRAPPPLTRLSFILASPQSHSVPSSALVWCASRQTSLPSSILVPA